MENVQRLRISFDGPPDVQNAQRPSRNPDVNSYQEVVRCFEFFDRVGFPYSVRATVADSSIARLPEIVEHITQVAKLAEIVVELITDQGPDQRTPRVSSTSWFET